MNAAFVDHRRSESRPATSRQLEILRFIAEATMGGGRAVDA